MANTMQKYHNDITAKTRFAIALVGDGKPFKAFAKIVCRPDFQEAFPGMTVAALAHIPKVSLRALPCFDSLPMFETHTALFQALPEVNMVIDLSDDGVFIDVLRKDAPSGCSVLHGDAASLIWELLISEKLCHTCMRDLRRAQDLFATLIDQVDEDILLLDADGRIVDVNRSIMAVRGGAKQDYIGRNCWELDGGSFCCPPEKGGCTFRETLQTGRKAERIHSRVTEDGKVQFYRIYTYPVFGQDGLISRIIEMRRDITHRTHMEQRLQQAEKMAAIGELSTYIAHEIRNPLFAIGGFANSLLRSPSLDEAAREKVEIILKESKRLDAILKTTLNFARPTDSDEGEVDLNLVTAETLQLMRIGCDERGLTFSVRLAPAIALAKGNAGMIKQCLINLVKNSLEAMTAGGKLTVITGMTQTHVFVTVEDTGHGIPDTLREKVFSPFFSTKDKGAGLGLAMTKKIVEEMGGYVELVSKEGEGTTVTLYLLPSLAVEGGDDRSGKGISAIPPYDGAGASGLGAGGDSPHTRSKTVTTGASVTIASAVPRDMSSDDQILLNACKELKKPDDNDDSTGDQKQGKDS
ncbi:ATP-binding protein [Desulfovibrio mangrovi]|uniref:two-component system sensor histidine kinase NtrB n=1 Tax=Desulfovibrio mangrovi TaxID=2976983 RepID=UPI0022457104|nr:ATP-binding protein [Desulfovibrio mangrovi]UZP68992.1 ATP-binding protein [Desulfovibrio mangrovi]